jgi:hypothetical protein
VAEARVGRLDGGGVDDGLEVEGCDRRVVHAGREEEARTGARGGTWRRGRL